MSKLMYIVFYGLFIQVSTRLLNDITDFYFQPSSERFDGEFETNGNCSKCPVGWGVRRLCTTHTPTECEKCVNGDTYSSQASHIGRCLPCSKCDVGLYEARKCFRRRDTVCDDCMRFIYKPEIKNNKDFREKCGYLFLSKSRFRGRTGKHETKLS